MLIDNAYYQCPDCLAVQEVEYATSGSTIQRTYWSDCFLLTPLWIDKPVLIKCWNCGKLHWVEDLQEYIGETDSWYDTDRKQSTGFRINPLLPMWHAHAKPTQDDYHYLLQERLFRKTLNEQEVRLQAFWARNDKFRYPVGWYDYTEYIPAEKKSIVIEVGPRVKDPNAGNLEHATRREIENMEALIAMIVAANTDENKFLHVELLRELGRFNEAIQLLDTIPADNGDGDVIINAQRGFCADKCTCVMEVELPQFDLAAAMRESIEIIRLRTEAMNARIAQREKDRNSYSDC